MWLRHALSPWLLLLLSHRTLSLRSLPLFLTTIYALRLLDDLPLRCSLSLRNNLTLWRGLLFSFLTAIYARLLHNLLLWRGLFLLLAATSPLLLLHCCAGGPGWRSTGTDTDLTDFPLPRSSFTLNF